MAMSDFFSLARNGWDGFESSLKYAYPSAAKRLKS